jgi:hypothetical protein
VCVKGRDGIHQIIKRLFTFGEPEVYMSKKTLAVDSDMIDLALDDLTKLILRLDNNPKKTRKEQNTIKKIQEIRDTIQDSVLYAKLKKSTE